ncbi:hypothetical protein Vlu01_37260 [Micromonospora lutea]|uniref:Uncharacterized protein n=1 Tax=Micromonospora lutea TaxID=419825 RepID=A0ABQ4IZ22_9ACTN|nr:hypothetical protein Vlu01_37260 [Micromonospora lutea]
MSKRGCIARRVYAAARTSPADGTTRRKGTLLTPQVEQGTPLTLSLRSTPPSGILDVVFDQRFYFYYGTGSPAAVGRA